MQQFTAQASATNGRSVILAVIEQRNARRGAAAPAEAASGLTCLHQGMLDALRREQARLEARRAAVTARAQVEATRHAYAAALTAA